MAGVLRRSKQAVGFFHLLGYLSLRGIGRILCGIKEGLPCVRWRQMGVLGDVGEDLTGQIRSTYTLMDVTKTVFAI